MPAQLSCSLDLEEEQRTASGFGSGGIVTEDFSIARHDIDFFNVGPDRVAIEIRVMNVSEHPSCPAMAVVMAAAFGAFVPWRPLATLPVPALPPGKILYLRCGAIPVRPEFLGSPDRLPPRKLLTALDLADDSPEPASQRKESAEWKPGSAALPADLMELLLQETPHWIGNLNVLVGNKEVERHLARALRVYPGRVNMAWFIVGSAGRDSYSFRLHGLAQDWDTKLFDMTTRESLVLNVAETPAIPSQQWIQTDGSRTMLLALRPPRDCPAGTVEVHVTQKSTGRTAIVEFSLDPKAAGRGCYAV